jgi:hypothetical protein
MISLPSALMRQFEERGPIDGPNVPTNPPYVLGIDLNRSESGCRRSPLALPTQPSINNTADGPIGFSHPRWWGRPGNRRIGAGIVAFLLAALIWFLWIAPDLAMYFATGLIRLPPVF